MILYLELKFAHEALALISKHLGDITDFFPVYFLKEINLITVLILSLDGGGIMATPM